MGRHNKEVTEAKKLLNGNTPVRFKGLTVLVPQHEIERLVREYATSVISSNGEGK